MHICVTNLGHHWFRWWLVTWSVPSHYLNQCCIIVNWTLRNKNSVKLYSKFKYFHSGKCIWKCYLENVSHFVSASMGYCCQVTTTPTLSVHIVPSVWSPGLTPAHVQSLQWLSNNQQGTHCTTQHRNLLQFSIYCPGSHVPEFNPWC